MPASQFFAGCSGYFDECLEARGGPAPSWKWKTAIEEERRWTNTS
jgi:hypothetical protein